MDIKILREEGYQEAMLGLSLNKNQPIERMPSVADKLAHKDGGHNKFLESIQVWIDITAPRYWWSQFDTYRVGVTKQSESTMHTGLNRPLEAIDFEGGIDCSRLRELNFYIEQKEFDKFKKMLPESFLQRRVVNTNYKALRNIYKQRKNHRLNEWKEFCSYIARDLEFGHWLD